MLASFCGGGLEAEVAEDEEGDDASAGIIGDLICQGASLGAQTDRTGETALHLAARYARADAAKRLLDAGADTNAQDNTGRTPLHAAVTADAQGVFQILIRNRSTDLDARMGDGSTALILAARLAVEGMVEELIACHADVNAVDETGGGRGDPQNGGGGGLRMWRHPLPQRLVGAWGGSWGKEWGDTPPTVGAGGASMEGIWDPLGG
uniref:Uncharacterized protein n=1 Tax=Strix occidentalis caurina TaxID=311401 RepID=A0A8D0FZ32_STROC